MRLPRLLLPALLLTAPISAQTATPTPPSQCGSRTQEALGYANGAIEGIKLRGPSGRPSDELLGIELRELSPTMDGSRCVELLFKTSLVVPEADSIPLLGIINVGRSWYVIVRVAEPAPGSSKRWVSFYYLDSEFVLRMSQTSLI